mmetsp:Transcript_47428/g.47856  ORF Transcript_47428/g.47856 Transcript_47428/m.47856 type:complete len:105 (-) Transcript_47428:583-897(-)
MYWENYIPNIKYWWEDNNGLELEQAILAEIRDDGIGYTLMVLNYYIVTIEGQEGGEYQKAPWFTTPREQIELAEHKGMITALSPSRSLDEWDDYVFLMHHPELF